MYFYFIFGYLLIMLVVDWYFYRGVKSLLGNQSARVRKWIAIAYWGFTLFSIVILGLALKNYITQTPHPKFARTYLMGFIMIVLVSKTIGITFLLIDDLKNGILYLWRRIVAHKSMKVSEGKPISRSAFLKKTGMIAAGLPFASLMYGVVKSAFDFRVANVDIHFPNLPKAFNGLKIVQISDIHSGSFMTDAPFKDAVRIINQQQADLVLFTGDMVNEIAEEALPFIDAFKSVAAPLGVFAVLGNHDYGDYFYPEGDHESRKHNKSLLQDIYGRMGWKLLLNENHRLERNGEHISLIGVENWGHKGRFQKYGDLDLAKSGVNMNDFQILMSHDPSHWDAKVRQKHPDIDLTLSGHTHGFQMGIEIPGFIKWSPSKYLYDQWAGLYQKGAQYIYVNRGLGFLGYPGRLGILPEITVLTLYSGGSA